MRWHDRDDVVDSMVSPHDGHLAYPAYNTRRHDIPTDAVDDFQFLDRKNEDDFGFGRNGQRYLGHVRTPQRSGDEYPNIPSDYRETRTRRRQMSQVSEGDSTDGTVVRQLLEEVLSTLKGRRPSSANVDLLERSAELKTRLFGLQNSATRKALQNTIVACNSLAMSALGRGNTARCKELLAKALEVAYDRRSQHHSSPGHDDDLDGEANRDASVTDAALQVLTLNNTACLHRRLGEPKRALRYLRQAAEVGRASGGSDHLEVTHLNACAVLSELGRHKEALEHARSAVFYNQEREEVARKRTLNGEAPEGPATGGSGENRTTRLATLAVSYYNLAVELEYTGQYDACLRWYNEAVKLAHDPDVRNDELVKTFQRSYAAARKKHEPRFDRILITRKRAAAREDHLVRKEDRSPLTGGHVNVVPRWDPSRRSSSHHDDHAVLRTSHAGRSFRDSSDAHADSGENVATRVEWPYLGRAERQVAGDMRRSNATGGVHQNMKSALAFAASGIRLNEDQPLLFRHMDPRLERSRRVATQDAFVEEDTRGNREEEWLREGHGYHRPESRWEGVGSAEVPTRGNPSERRRCDIKPHPMRRESSNAIPEEPTWQPPRADAVCRTLGQSEGDIGRRAAGGRRTHVHQSKRPTSAYPRLEDQSRSGAAGSGIGGVGNGSTGTGSASRACVDRDRCRSAGSSRRSMIPMMSVVGHGRCEDRRSSGDRSRNENADSMSKRTDTAQRVVECRANANDKGRAKRARTASIGKGIEEGAPGATECRKRSLGERKRRQSGTAETASVGLKCPRKGAAALARVTTSSARPNRPGPDVQGGHGSNRGDRATLSRNNRREYSSSRTNDRGMRNDGEDLSGGMASGRDGKMYTNIETQDEVVQACSETSREKRNVASCQQQRQALQKVEGVTAEETLEGFSAPEAAEGPVQTAGEATIADAGSVLPHDLELRTAGHSEVTGESAIGGILHDTATLDLDGSGSQCVVVPHGIGERKNTSAAIIQQALRRFFDHRNIHRRRSRAASVIQTWIFRVYPVHRRRQESAEDLRRRWEREIRQIAANHIQAFVRGGMGRRAYRRRVRAAGEVQRVVRGRKGRIEAEKVARNRRQKQHVACESIQRLFRGHRGRRRAVKRRQIHREDLLARNGAAQVIQSAWCFQVCRQQQRQKRRVSASQPRHRTPTSSQVIEEAPESPPRSTAWDADDASEFVAESTLPARQELEERLRSEEIAYLYTLWGAFGSLLTASATRYCVHRDVAAALLSSPVAATLSCFNRGRQIRCKQRPTTSAKSTRTRVVATRRDGSEPDCIDHVVRAARRRLAGAARARLVSRSTVQTAAANIIGGGNERNASALDAGREAGEGAPEEAARREVMAITLESVQECWALLVSSAGSLVGLDDGSSHQRLTAILTGTLQEFITDLSQIISLLGPDPTGLRVDYTAGISDRCAQVRLCQIVQTPMNVIAALASSAAASLMSHPDFAETLLTAAVADDQPTPPAWDEERDRGYGRLVAEAYGAVLGAPFASGVSPCDGALPLRADEENKHATQDTRLVGNNSSSEHVSTEVPSWQCAGICVRSQERCDLLLSLLARTEDAAEELVCILEASCASASGRIESGTEGREEQIRDGFADLVISTKRYVGAMESLADDVWRLAVDVVSPNDDDGDGDALLIERAASVMQKRARGHLARKRWATMRREKTHAAVAIQHCARRRVRRIQCRQQKQHIRSFRESLAAHISASAIEEAIVAVTSASLIESGRPKTFVATKSLPAEASDDVLASCRSRTRFKGHGNEDGDGEIRRRRSSTATTEESSSPRKGVREHPPTSQDSRRKSPMARQGRHIAEQ